MFGDHGLCGLLEEGAHGKSPKCLGGNLGDFGEFCKGLNKWITIPFDVPFSERPMVNVVLDIQDPTIRISYVGNITTEGFDIGINYAPSLNGLWYQAWIVDK